MTSRDAWVEVDLDAVAHNVRWLRGQTSPAVLCAVVKADGYGHGAAAVARAALAAGADRLAVATVDEGLALRAAGLEGRILVLSEPAVDEWATAERAGLEPAVYSASGVAAAGAAAHRRSAQPWDVHLKVDTGMRRVGCSPVDAVALAGAVAGTPGLRLASLWSHLAIADEPDDPFTAQQVALFSATLAAVRAAGIVVPEAHLANSAGGIAHPAARFDVVRAGIALYGLAPSPTLAAASRALRPAMAVKARVAMVKRVCPGETVSYGRRWEPEHDTVVATLPLGYADGVSRRAFGAGVEVLVGGRRCPIVGVVTMDQLMVDCGPDAHVARGDEAVLVGAQGTERITADEWAARLGTITYEVVCGFSRRLTARYTPAEPPARPLGGPVGGLPGGTARTAG